MRKTVLNAFTPSNVISEPGLFAGRRNLVKSLADSLQIDGSCPIIFGERGVGKSSLAVQAMRIGTGDVELLNILGLESHALSERAMFQPFWIPCNEQMKNSNDIVRKIVRNIYRLIENPNSITTTTKIKLNFKVFEEETTTVVAPNEPIGAIDVEEDFLSAITKAEQKGIARFLFILDEFDRVESSTGIANFVKNNSSESIKFIFVGIADNISQLLSDHSSLERQLFPVNVPGMIKDELMEITSKVEAYLGDNNIDISFADSAKKKLALLAGGFPWFVHVIGQDTLINAFDKNVKEITDKDVEASVSSLADNRYANQFSDLYFKAVRDSQPREIFLRLLAKWGDDNIPLSEIYKLTRSLKISNPSTLKNQLMDEKFGEVIFIPVGHKRGLVRFCNKMFKRYVNLRLSLFNGVAEKVDEAWKNF